jgi:hypothetical protein
MTTFIDFSISLAMERLKFQMEKLTFKDSVEDWENLLSRLLETLHPHNFLVMNAKRFFLLLFKLLNRLWISTVEA